MRSSSGNTARSCILTCRIPRCAVTARQIPLDPTVSRFHNLGPLIQSQTDRPVRIKFTNNLPVGAGGNLFVPVDKTLMGAGMGPLGMNTSPIYYTENRAEIHLHGGNTPWISDGTPHQWITPAGEYTAYPEGASVVQCTGYAGSG